MSVTMLTKFNHNPDNFIFLLEWIEVDWTAYKEVERQAVEIYSLHGSSELYDPTDPLAYENCDMTLTEDTKSIGLCNTGYSRRGPNYAQDAWAEGLVIGAISGSDDHRAQPGKRGGGLTAVLAPSLTRDGIIEGIRKRHTYATTGDRIILDFKINGKLMGSVIEPSSTIQVQIRAEGSAPIKFLQLMRYEWESNKWKAVIEEYPDSTSIKLDQTLESPIPAIYYVRLEQEKSVNGRPVRAWSSPIWIGKLPGNK